MRIIGLISDTHGSLPPGALEALAGVDEILHAGDVGGEALVDELEALASTVVVRGNTDWGGPWPGERIVEREGHLILLIHDIGQVDRPSFDLLRRIRSTEIDLVIFGHSHRPADYTIGPIRFVNPGSAGHARSAPPTVARLTLTHESIDVQHVRI